MCAKKKDAFNYIAEMLGGLNGKNRCMPPTSLYSEGWMLRLILQAASEGHLEKFIPTRAGKLNWFSEARLYTPFRKGRGKAYEGFTNVDGIVGDFQWNSGTQTGVELSDNPKRFEVFEAKMFSGLSKGVKADPEYDQAVRTVACMAETLENAKLKRVELESLTLAYWVIAPQSQINKGLFKTQLSKTNMRKRIKNRIEQFDGPEREELRAWKTKYFEPLLKKLDEDDQLRCISWETLIKAIGDENRRTAIKQFYIQCCLAARRKNPYIEKGG
ncbi:MAG: hypothetical protein CME32_26480 [Gimesia sp.]|nr:hypothetical protein [Gimesia sp.]